jgi:O-antigen ligase
VTFTSLWRRFVTPSPFHSCALLLLALAVPLALLPLPTLALALLYTLLILLALINPVFGLYWAILSVPVQETVHLPGGISYTQGAMLLAVGAWALHTLAHPERPLLGDLLMLTGKRAKPTKDQAQPPSASHAANSSKFMSGWLWLWIAFVWALLLSLAFSPYSRTEAAKELLRWIEAFLIWLMVVALVRRPWQVAGLIACLLLAPVAEALVGMMQFLRGSGPPSFRIAPTLPFVRAYGTIGQPNSFAGYMNMAWPLALALAVGATLVLWQGRLRRPTTDDRRSERKPLSVLNSQFSISYGLVALLLLAALAASLSRGAWVGAACGVVGMALALGAHARRWALAGLVLGALVLALGGAGLLPAILAERLSSIIRYLVIFDAGAVAITPQNFAVVERMAQMQAGWNMFLAHPLTGVGPGNYTPAYPHVAVGSWYASRGHAHNYYIHILAETGLIGALAYLALLGGSIRQAIATLRAENALIWRSAAIGCCGIIAAVAGHDLFENLHVLSMGIQLAAIWGLLVVLEKPVAR